MLTNTKQVVNKSSKKETAESQDILDKKIKK